MGIMTVVNNMTKNFRGGVFGIFDIHQRRKQYRKRPDATESYFKMVTGYYESCLQRINIGQVNKEEAIRKLQEDLKREDFLVLPRVVISLTNRCSLRCRDCNALIPYAKEKYDRPILEQIRDIERLLEVVDRICCVELIGGEPFLYKNIGSILEYCLKSPKIDQVEITTNGTIMPSEQLIELMKNEKCFVMFSDYGEINEKSKEIVNQLRHVCGCVIDLQNRMWYDSGDMKKRGKSKRRIRYEFFMCDCKNVCRTLYKGKLYICGRAPILHEIGKATSQTDFLDLNELSDNLIEAKKAIKDFFMSEVAEACDYCDYASDWVKYVPSGVQLR